MHTHISREDRTLIAAGLRQNHSYQQVADIIAKTKSAVWQEVHRNKDPRTGTYNARAAHKRAMRRRKKSKRAYRKIETTPPLERYITHRLEPLVSPEVVAYECGIHHQTIYLWIYRSCTKLRKQLPYRGKKRRKYGTKRGKKQGWTAKVRSIHDRPNTPLSWEGDTLLGTTKARVLTHVERTSLYLRADLLENGTADEVQGCMKDKVLPGTITYDRGSEFALWKMIEKDGSARIYFADPHAPHQRGKNENTNGRIRRVFPKGTDFRTLTKSTLDRVVYTMNHTPRKSLNWRTPADVYEELRLDSD